MSFSHSKATAADDGSPAFLERLVPQSQLPSARWRHHRIALFGEGRDEAIVARWPERTREMGLLGQNLCSDLEVGHVPQGIVVRVTAFFALIATGNLSAQYDLVKVITDRQGVMFDIQSAYWPLLEVKNGKSTDLAAAAAASQSIEDALGRFSALLLPGTAKGEVPGSRANPEVWTEPADFAEALNALQAAAAALSDAASGDIELFKARFDTFASACVGCHAFKPSGGGRFRAPK